ncbi:MAG: asparagine synthase (glutamine-hydrolyzing) [Deltaproteobacteria bacterium]|nr:asparagine synthase (glutamine-hydrolyzing) [Deltaproteobacteria bacterium]
MCGICGKLNFDSQEPVDPRLLARMGARLQHRGPDGGGEYLRGPVGLGHRRLSIIDLATGDQPMSNEDGTIWVVYNGEIYNFPELRAELLAAGHRFKSATDTEVILHLYEEVGVRSVERLRGMFAFALWDERKQLLLLARDRVGIKPLYYIQTDRALLFASEVKSLLVDPTVRPGIDPGAIDRFLTYYYLPGSETLWKGIYKLDPGHYLTVQQGRLEAKAYWDLHFETQTRKPLFAEAVAELKGLLARTVKDHLISDVPVGVLLSGGVDSTGVLRYAVEQSDRPVHTFTIGFDGEDFADERPFARLAARRFGTNHREITMTSDAFRDFLPRYVWHMEEPVCEPPAVALYFVARLARETQVKVLLSGEGGDEAFGGYQTYRNFLFLESLKSRFGPLKGLLRPALRGLGSVGVRRLGKFADLVPLTLGQYYLSRTTTPTTGFNALKPLLYTKDFAGVLARETMGALPTRRLFDRVRDQSLLNQMLYVDTKSWLPDDLLVKADKMTMATSVELRVPWLDFQVLEFAAALPQEFKVSGWKTKRILKAALQDVVPPEIIHRKKTGLPVPYERWLRSELRDFVHDTLLGRESRLYDYFHRPAVQRLLERYQAGEGLAKEVFCLIVLQLWFGQFRG